jgi:hypothetical protein
MFVGNATACALAPRTCIPLLRQPAIWCRRVACARVVHGIGNLVALHPPPPGMQGGLGGLRSTLIPLHQGALVAHQLRERG